MSDKNSQLPAAFQDMHEPGKTEEWSNSREISIEEASVMIDALKLPYSPCMMRDIDILAAISQERLSVMPLRLSAVQPASVDFRLGNKFYVRKDDGKVIDPYGEMDLRWDRLEVEPGGYFDLPAGGFALGVTLESVKLGSDIAAQCHGKSSLGRLGLLVHVTAGKIDPGFSSPVTLELANLMKVPIRLRPGMPIAQLDFFQLRGPVENYYGKRKDSKYTGDSGGWPVVSRYWKNDIDLTF